MMTRVIRGMLIPKKTETMGAVTAEDGEDEVGEVGMADTVGVKMTGVHQQTMVLL